MIKFRFLPPAMIAIVAVAGAVQAAQTGVQTNDAGPVVQNSDAMAAADQAGHPLNMRQQIQDQLMKDGYTGATVMPSSFSVQAKDKQGNPVAMVIGPDTFTAVTDIAPASGTSTSPDKPKQEG